MRGAVARRRPRQVQRQTASSRTALVAAALLVLALAVLGQGASGHLGAATLILAGALLVVCLVAYAWLRWRRRQRSYPQTLGELLVLSPQQFEIAVGELLRRCGFADVQRVGGAGDLTVDLCCRDHQGRRVAVQCKRYAPGARIGSPAMQAFIGMLVVRHQAAYGIFVTTAQFSAPAHDLAGLHHVTLVDGDRLARLLHDAARNAVDQGQLIPAGVPGTSRLAMLARWLGR